MEVVGSTETLVPLYKIIHGVTFQRNVISDDKFSEGSGLWKGSSSVVIELIPIYRLGIATDHKKHKTSQIGMCFISSLCDPATSK
jgi:hypothetical protein